MTATCTTVGKLLAPAGEAARAFDAMWDAVWNNPYIPATLLDRCRLILAEMNRAAAELSTQAAHWEPTDAERAVLEFAEMYGLDAASITDEQAEAVKRHWGEPALVFLIEALGMIDARIRLALMMPALAR